MLRTPYLRLDDDLVPFLESGCALVLGSTGSGGAPYAARGWGLDVLDAAAGRIRAIVVDADLPFLGEGGPVAVTCTSVRTLHSIQLKGRVEAVEATASPADADRSRRYADDYLGDIVESDGLPLGVIQRMLPTRPLAAITVVVDQLFDQTPGPAAGAALHR